MSRPPAATSNAWELAWVWMSACTLRSRCRRTVTPRTLLGRAQL